MRNAELHSSLILSDCSPDPAYFRCRTGNKSFTRRNPTYTRAGFPR